MKFKHMCLMLSLIFLIYPMLRVEAVTYFLKEEDGFKAKIVKCATKAFILYYKDTKEGSATIPVEIKDITSDEIQYNYQCDTDTIYKSTLIKTVQD